MLTNKQIIKYYYDFILQSSLESLTFPKKNTNFEKELKEINFFLSENGKRGKEQKDNFRCIAKHIKNLSKKERQNYKIVFFPFVNEFTEVSKTREEKIYSTPVYFVFNIEENYKRILVELKNIVFYGRDRYIQTFKEAQLIFNSYYASNKLYVINHDSLSALKEELNGGEFEKLYPEKDFSYYANVFEKYIQASNLNVLPKKNLYEMINGFNEELKKKINKKEYLNTLNETDNYALVALVNSEKLLSGDFLVKGLLEAYKNSIIPYFENISPGDRLNRVLFKHPDEYFEKQEIEKNEKNTLDINENTFKELQKKHLGSFNSQFAVTLSQRLALCAYLSPMDIIPVNGPPGTGKTALLRAVFADYIVKTAFKAKKSYDENRKDPYSFIDTGKPILGTSSVRQAINNIIEGISGGFKEAKETRNVLYKRWLDLPEYEAEEKTDLIKEDITVPQIRNSENRYKNGILYTGKKNIFEYLFSLNAENLEKKYLEYFYGMFGVNTDIDGAVEILFDKMNGLKKEIENEIEQNPVLQTYEKLDTTLRFDMFFVSLHLLEAFFIVNIKRLNRNSAGANCPVCGGNITNTQEYFICGNCGFKIKKDKTADILTTEDLKNLLNGKFVQNEKNYSIKRFGNEYRIIEKKGFDFNDINNIFLITPLFPMLTVTMHSLFGAFKYKKENRYVIENGFFDLVLSDESGMILAPVAMPALYAAKKMVVVGDEKQIEPVYPFDEIIDKSIIKNIDENIDYSRFRQLHSALGNNFLKAANGCVKFSSFEMKEYENGRLWLKEHFRCKDEIVGYCNKIVYKGILIPKVRTFKKHLYLDDAKEMYPSMKIFNVDSRAVNNSSREEADKIAAFLSENLKKLCDLYNEFNKKNVSYEDFHSHIGIVTPFNNQKKLIQKKLKTLGFNLHKILVGTVHAFQGSEREIIIFSPVMDKNHSGTHFANSDEGNMMNVAVSRAKSAFWVFGSKEGMKNAGEYTKALVEYIEENFGCKLKCPLCGGCVIEKEKFFACENYKYDFKTGRSEGCEFIVWKNGMFQKEDIEKLLNNETVKIKTSLYRLDTDARNFVKKINVCPECGGDLILREGKYGKFYGCSNYPKCRYTGKAE
jgi:hypothetical protein